MSLPRKPVRRWLTILPAAGQPFDLFSSYSHRFASIDTLLKVSQDEFCPIDSKAHSGHVDIGDPIFLDHLES